MNIFKCLCGHFEARMQHVACSGHSSWIKNVLDSVMFFLSYIIAPFRLDKHVLTPTLIPCGKKPLLNDFILLK